MKFRMGWYLKFLEQGILVFPFLMGTVSTARAELPCTFVSWATGSGSTSGSGSGTTGGSGGAPGGAGALPEISDFNQNTGCPVGKRKTAIWISSNPVFSARKQTLSYRCVGCPSGTVLCRDTPASGGDSDVTATYRCVRSGG